jgi:hypothetical protein
LAAPSFWDVDHLEDLRPHPRTEPDVHLPPGAIGLDERLFRLEGNDHEILRKLENLTTKNDMYALSTRVDAIERSYVSKAVVTAVVVFCVVQFIVIIGMGLGLVYELLRP